MFFRGSRRCLLIIDAQEAWRDKKSPFYIGDLKSYISATNKLLAWARQNKVPVIFSLHQFKKDGSDILPSERGQVDDFISGNPRAALIGGLNKNPADIVLIKNRFSVFSNKSFEKLLERLKAKEVIIGGITTNCCVRATIIDLYNLAYKITVIREACVSDSRQTDEFTFKDLASLLGGIKIISLNKFLKEGA